jgi:hypothetical protein
MRAPLAKERKNGNGAWLPGWVRAPAVQGGGSPRQRPGGCRRRRPRARARGQGGWMTTAGARAMPGSRAGPPRTRGGGRFVGAHIQSGGPTQQAPPGVRAGRRARGGRGRAGRARDGLVGWGSVPRCRAAARRHGPAGAGGWRLRGAPEPALPRGGSLARATAAAGGRGRAPALPPEAGALLLFSRVQLEGWGRSAWLGAQRGCAARRRRRGGLPPRRWPSCSRSLELQQHVAVGRQAHAGAAEVLQHRALLGERVDDGHALAGGGWGGWGEGGEGAGRGAWWGCLPRAAARQARPAPSCARQVPQRLAPPPPPPPFTPAPAARAAPW